MAGASKWKERFRAYAKGFRQNWELFKASRIGLVGIGIMIFFIIMAVSAPYLGLRDPILWFAPDEDIIDVNQYHRIDTNSSLYNLRPDDPPIPISNEISFRVRPKSEEPRTDRVYVTTDNELWAVRPITGRQGWAPTSFVADSSITTPVVVVNLGHHTEPSKADFVLLFGTASGRLYALNDSNQVDPRPTPPTGANNFSVSLDGSPVVSVAAYSGDIQPGRQGSVRMEQDIATDLDGIDTPFVVKGPFPSGTAYRAYYTGNGSGTWRILSAASDDGLRFDKREGPGDNIRIDAGGTGGNYDSQGAMDPFVFRRSDGNWTMYYVGNNGTAYTILGADSSDGMEWVKTGVVLSSTGPEDSQGIRRPWLVRSAANDWTLFYAGYNGTSWQILSADSADRGGSWTAPVIRVADASHPTVYPTQGGYGMLFSRNVSGEPRIFGATSPDLVTWSGATERVGVGMTMRLVDAGGLFDPLELEAHVSTGVMSPSVLSLEDGTYRLYYVATFFDSTRGASGENVAAVVSGTSLDGVTWSREHTDIYVATTTSGKVYAFSAVDNQLLWQTTVADVPARVAGTPLVPINDPTYSQAFNTRGSVLVVGTQDGVIHGLRTRDGGPAWNETFDLQMESGSWYTAPVVAERNAIPTASGTEFADVVYAASGDGWLYAMFADTGKLIPEWDAVAHDPLKPLERDGIPVKSTASALDGGNLSAPTVRGTTIYVGSSEGRAYAVYRDNVGETIKAGDVKWKFEDPALMAVNATMSLRATNLHTLELVFFVANHDNGTPSNPNDDRSAVYGVALDGELSWKQNIEGRIAGPVIVWRSEEPVIGAAGQLQPAAWWGTDRGVVYAFSATGRMIAPLPPTWLEPLDSGNVYWLGTDSRGRDLFSQFMFGAQIALIVGFLAAFFSISIGVIVGLVAGYSGKRVEAVLMRFTDVILVLPGLPLVIILSAVLGASIWNIIFVISIVGWPGVARVIRAEVLSLKERPFIDSARVTGASNIRIMFRHVAPNILPLAFLYMTFAVSGAILTEAALSFLGLGDVNTPSWGQMLEAIQRQNVLGSWWWLWPPGLGITMLSLAFYLVGRGYEQIVNPRLRRR